MQNILNSKLKIVLGALMAFVLAVGLTLPASGAAYAAAGDPQYLSPGNGTTYTNITTSTTTVDLYTWLTLGDYSQAGFASTAQAETVTWSIVDNSEGVLDTSQPLSSLSFTDPNTGTIYAKTTVTMSTGTGVSSVLASYTPAGSSTPLTLNLTVAKDATEIAPNFTTYGVFIVDTTGVWTSPNHVKSFTSVAVVPPARKTSGLLYNETGAFQNLPTAAGTLDALNPGSITASITSNGSYVNSIDGLAAQTAEPYNGWLYAVYAGNTLVTQPDSNIYSSSINKLTGSERVVVWKYGSYGTTFKSSLFSEMASWYGF